jgi:hypothetical protein
MVTGPRLSKLQKRLLVGFVMAALEACQTSAPRPSPDIAADPAEQLPRRLVLALDGMDFRDIEQAKANGLFRQFRQPGRLISTFPSISDIAWHAIFGVQPPAGYQRVYYSVASNRMVGDALSAITPIEYEQRMDAAFDARFHHLGAYLISDITARREVATDIKKVLGSRGRATYYIYNVGPDALQHTRGDLAGYLKTLDAGLDTLQARYRQRTGRSLELVVLSDHGHNRAADAAFLPLVDSLAVHGFVAAKSLESPNDVVFSVDGVTTGFGIFCLPSSEERLSITLASIEGVELVTRRVTANRFEVRSRMAGQWTVIRSNSSRCWRACGSPE